MLFNQFITIPSARELTITIELQHARKSSLIYQPVICHSTLIRQEE